MFAAQGTVAEREKIQYDTSYHPLYIKRDTLSSYSPTLSAVCHYHDDLEFIYMLKGHITYNVNGINYRISEKEGIFVNSKNLHYGYSADGQDCTFICILLNPLLLVSTQYLYYQYVLPLTENRAFPAQVLHSDVPWMRELNALLVRTYEVYDEKADGCELMLQSLFYRIWLLLYKNMPVGEMKSRNETEIAVVRTIVSYIQDHNAEKICLSDLAAAGNISVSYCCRLFKRYLQQSPMTYLRSCRLNRACSLLSDASVSITEISYRCGFSGTSYFIERFREKYGVTPAYYRKHIIKGS